MTKPVLLQVPSKFYEVAPVFYAEAKKYSNIDKFYIWTDYDEPYGLGDDCVVVQGKDKQFTENMRLLLKSVEEENFYIFCEDHIVKSKTDKDGMDRDWDFATSRGDCGFLRLSYGGHVPQKSIGKYAKILPKFKYYVSLQPAVWKKEFFEKTLISNLDSWQYEPKASRKVAKDPNHRSYMVMNESLSFTNFYREGKYYRRQFVDYAVENNIKLNHDWPVYWKKNPIPMDQYLKEKKQRDANRSA